MPTVASETVVLPSRPDSGPETATLSCPVRWHRSRRARHVSLRIDPRAGTVIVTLPPRTARRAGVALLDAHAAWVRDSLAALAPPTPLVTGAIVRIGDVPHRVRRAPRGTARTDAWIESGAIHVPGPPAETGARILALLRAEAGRRIGAVAARDAALLGTTYRGLRLKDTRSRWGSCAPDGTLAFSWRIVMAPDWVLNYVVAHEVAHLRELNHSPRFWAHVTRLSPHRDAAVTWLKAHGPALLRVG